MDTEFRSDKVKKKIWLEIKKDLDADKKPSASDIARRLNMNYIDVNNIYKDKLIKKLHVTNTFSFMPFS